MINSLFADYKHAIVTFILILCPFYHIISNTEKINKKNFIQSIRKISVKNFKNISKNHSSWFDNYQNYKIGDNITILLYENDKFQNIFQDSLKKKYNSLYIFPVVLNKRRLCFRKKSKNTRQLNIHSEIRNKIYAKISVRVVKILSNNYLKVFGEKKIFIDNHVKKIKCYGVINPKKINLNYSISSSKVSHLIIKYQNKNIKKNFFFSNFKKKCLSFFKKIKNFLFKKCLFL